MFSENEIKILGFEKNEIEDLDDSIVEYYYSYDIVNGLSLITNTNIGAEKEGWGVELFNVDPPIKFSNFYEVQLFMNSMETKIVKK